MTADLLELQVLTETDRPITYGVVKPGAEDPEKGVLFVRGGDIADGSIDTSLLRTITQEVSAPYARTILRGGEVVISLVGNPGAVAVVPDSLAGANLARQVGLIALKPEYHAPYIKYYLMSPQGKAELFQRTQGAVQQVINLADLKKIKVRVLPRPEQERIAGVLSAYDDLIENNRRRIALLEQAARLLYREWFVYLRFPGHEHLKVVDGVPEGWGRSPIRSRFKTVLGGTPSRKRADYWEGGTIPWINSGMVNEIRIVVPSELITPLALAESAAKLMPAKTTVLAITGATLGQVSMLEIECAANQSVVGVIDESGLLSEYIYLCLKDRAKELIGLGTGGAQIHINKDVVNAFEVLIPDDALAREFTDFVKPIFSQVRCLAMTNLRLEMARDLLLPRLMSGELAV